MKFTHKDFIIPLLVLLAIVMSCCHQVVALEKVSAVNGIIDLRSHSFDLEETIELDGIWNFYSSEFLISSEGVQSNNSTPIEVPVRWDQSSYPDRGYGSYQLTIYKNTNTPLALRIPDLFSAYNLFINNELLASMGKPGKDAETSEPGRQTKLISLGHIGSDTLNLVIHISNFVHRKGGIGNSIVLGTYKELSKKKFQDDAFDFFLAGCLVMGVFFFLGLFVFGRKEKTALYFALFCMAYAYRIVGWGNYVLHDLVDVPYELGITVEFATFYLCGYFFAKYIKHLFPNDSPTLFIDIFAYFSLSFAFLSLLPVHIVSKINFIFLYGVIFGIAVISFTIIKALINKTLGANYAIFSTFGIFIVFGMKTLDYLGFMHEVSSVSVFGQLLFFFFQSLILSQHFSKSWRAAKSAAESAMEAKSEFLSVMSHEIRTPLNAVVGSTEYLLSEAPRKDQEDELRSLKTSSKNLINLVNNVLDFSKIDAGKVDLDKSDVKLKEYCSNALNIFHSIIDKDKVELKFEYDDNLPDVVKLDKVRVNQVLGNLIGNAAKFTKNGRIKLEVIQLALTDQNVEVEFKIEDTGIGISDADQPVVFDSFRQANSSVSKEYGGTGLGLFITNKLVTMMGSEVTLQSNLGTGSCFSFRLVLPIGDPTNVELKPESDINLEGYKVLLVEDNVVNTLIAKRLLTKWKLEVVVAENGKIAVEKSQHNTFDLVLMDLRMPEMDGYEATKILRDLGFKMPILAVTASPQLQNSSKIAESGFDGFVLKPYNREDLFRAISDKLLSDH